MPQSSDPTRRLRQFGADALSTTAFRVGRNAAPELLARFGAEALFVDKAGRLSRNSGFPALSG